MNIVCRACINCTMVELRTFWPFIRAMDFSKYHSDITILCIDNGQSLNLICTPFAASTYSWTRFRAQWEAKNGPLHR